MTSPLYCGRFAPSPTGPLHFGSLVAAVGSFLDARSQGGRWLVRIEDLDPPREIPGSSARILRSLAAHGLEWDGTVVVQSTRLPSYHAALAQLRAAGLTYRCVCSRKEIADSIRVFGAGAQLRTKQHASELVYPGTCRAGIPANRNARVERVRVGDAMVAFNDLLQGPAHQHLATDVGDFVLRRADGLIAYQLAVVVDDAEQRITTVVRGADLFDSTPRQIYLQRLLGLPTPQYLHLPVVVNAAGEKLSKQTRAQALRDDNASASLIAALRFLGHDPGDDALGESPATVLDWAIRAWQRDRLPRTRTSLAPG